MKNRLLTFLLMTVLPFGVYAEIKSKNKTTYKTYFGSCPSRTAGSLTLQLVKAFEKSQSLLDVKKKIVKEKLTNKHFISDYKISYDPLKNYIKFKYDCPEPLMKVQIYKENGVESYEAILVDNGNLFDPTYEVLLRAEKKLIQKLPYLAIPVGKLGKKEQHELSSLIGSLEPAFRNKLSEVILDDSEDLTIILSIEGRPSSVFMGKDKWGDKLVKLKKIVGFMEKKRKVPAIINLTNYKKVVVKFNDKF